MLLRIAVVNDQLGLVAEIFRDLRMLIRKVVPGLKLLRIDVAGVGSPELDRGVSVDDSAELLSFLRRRQSGESDWKGDCNQHNEYTVNVLYLSRAMPCKQPTTTTTAVLARTLRWLSIGIVCSSSEDKAVQATKVVA
jgi:hypothetical protein